MTLAKREDFKHLLLVALARLCAAGCVSWRGHARLIRLLGDLDHCTRRAQRRRITARIAAACGRPAAEIEHLARGVFRSNWANNEVFWLQCFARSAAWRKTACTGLRIEGLHHLHEALARGQGAILWESSLGHRVLAKLALIEKGFRLTQVHGREHGGSAAGSVRT